MFTPSTLGSKLIYQSATGLERAMADVDVHKLLSINAELIIDTWDPWRTTAQNLPYLAWALGVSLWDDAWPEAVQRRWVADQWKFKAARGTVVAIEMALEVMSYPVNPGGDLKLLQYVTPPQGLFLGTNASKSEFDAWLSLLPEIRIYKGKYFESDDGAVWFDDPDETPLSGAGGSFMDAEFLPVDRGPVLAGRRTTLFRNGVETNLRTYESVTRVENGVGIDFERVALDGLAGAALFKTDGFLDSEFIGGEEVTAKIVTYELHRDYYHSETDFPVTYVVPYRPEYVVDAPEPWIPRYERGTREGFAGWGMCVDGDPLTDYFLVPDNSPFLVFDRLRYYDPDIEGPVGLKGDFLDDARLGMPKRRAELMIQADRILGPMELVLDQDFVGENFLVDDDLTRTDRALKSVEAAMALDDTIQVTFQTTRPIEFRDHIRFDGQHKFASRARRYL